MREAEAKKSGRVNASSNFVLPVIKDMPLKGTKNEQSKGEPNLILGKSIDQAKRTRDSKGKSLQNKSKAGVACGTSGAYPVLLQPKRNDVMRPLVNTYVPHAVNGPEVLDELRRVFTNTSR